MNDTETEARLLMTKATSDMPDGIDLLGGFTRARARARRRRGRAVVSAGVAVAAGGVAIALTVGSAPAARTVGRAPSAVPAHSALTAVTTALDNTVHTQSYRETQDFSEYYPNLDGKATTPTYRDCLGEEDAAAGLETYSCPGDANFTELEAGGWVYQYMATVDKGYDYKHWLRIKASELGSLSASSPIGNVPDDSPQQILSAIEKGAKVTTVGPTSGSGWTGTRYAFTWTGNPVQAANVKPETISGTIDVDQQGRTRVLDFNQRLTAEDGTVLVTTIDETFSDFGVKVTVNVPPANQVYTLNPYYRGNRTGPSR